MQTNQELINSWTQSGSKQMTDHELVVGPKQKQVQMLPYCACLHGSHDAKVESVTEITLEDVNKACPKFNLEVSYQSHV